MRRRSSITPAHGELRSYQVSVRVSGKGNLGARPRGEVIADILASIKERRAT
ncbi:MAG TPA: hypothetical protein VJU77_17510 [Chthoniobacterales bacterium]|nr:hypothetical protein [Chthoniobacterales bacterium]